MATATATKKTRKPTKRVKEQQAWSKDRAAEMQESIKAKVEAMESSDEWKAYLDYMGSFHRYSFRNMMLIFSQNPEAERVAGYRQWKLRGRAVRPEEFEKPILIFGFQTKKVEGEDAKTGETKTEYRPYFPVKKVYDISQTELMEGFTDPVEDVHPAIEGDDVDDLYGKLAGIMESWGWTVEKESIAGSCKGVTYPKENRIVIHEGMSPLESVGVLMHECAHALLHADLTDEERAGDIHRGYREVEAESTAYVLAGMVGLDNSKWSTGYITGWAQGDTELLTTTAGRVLWCVHSLADALAALDNADAEDDSEESTV